MELRADAVGFSYRGAQQPALAGVDLTIGDGVTALVGVNGAGKSTLLRILARSLRPAVGSVTLDGDDVHRTRRREMAPRIALMPQDFRLPVNARVLDGLAYLGWLRGVPSGRIVDRSREVLALVGLADRAEEKVTALSGGMVRRLALAQALVAEPEVLLLDEPTTGLDPEQRAAVRALLAGDLKAPITLVSSHLMDDVAALADRVVMLDQGAVLFAGTMAEFTARPDGFGEEPEAAFLRRLFEAQR